MGRHSQVHRPGKAYYYCFVVLRFCIFMTQLGTKCISALNDEGQALQEFGSRLDHLSGGITESLGWNYSHSTPCGWAGVACSQDLHVVSINVSGKQLRGNLTLDVNRFIQLQALNFSSNVFRGAIPSFWGDSASLRILDLSNNKLSGEIPKEFDRLLSLSFLNVSNNDLEGALPQGGSFALFNGTSFEGNDRLCGYPTGRACVDSSIRSLLENTADPSAKFSVGDSGSQLSTGTIVLICVFAFAISKITLFLVWYWRRKKTQNRCEVTLSGGRMIMFQLTGQVTPLAKAVLQKAVKLKPQDIIGSGGYGTVYKLVLDDMSAFAVKKLNRGGLSRDSGFERELQTLADVKHRNLCTLRGYYSAPNINLLVYDLMPNGNLETVLHDYASRNTEPLDWEVRLKIALGVARGLSYLHYDCIPHIIHRDIKCSNILLDEHMEAHVADFGLAKFINPNETHVTTTAAGTLGYLPPEYLDTGKITEKGDVYSFGIVLLELLTGKRPNDESFRDHEFCIVQWASALLAENHPEDIFDNNILGSAPDEDLLTLLSIAMHCTDGVPKARPSMQHIVKMLQKLCGEDDVISGSISLSRRTSSGALKMQTQTQPQPKSQPQTSVKASLETAMIYPCDDAV